ncbi:MAG: hypothetical protein AB7K09_14180 [Planctomycetota bacterium]
MPSRTLPTSVGLLASLLVALPLVLGACCGADRVDIENANDRAPVNNISKGDSDVTSPMQCWMYLVEALDPQFIPPAAPAEGAPVPPGRPWRVHFLLAAEVRDRVGTTPDWMKAWPARRQRLLQVFNPARTPAPPDEADDPSKAEANATRTLVIPAAGDQPAIELTFVYQSDPTRVAGENNLVWRLTAKNLEAVLFEK